MRLLTIKRPLTVCSADCCGGKLLNSGVNGKVLRVIRDMYAKPNSCVKTRHRLSQFFVSNVGLRQGGNLSPVLFSLFLNDLKGFLTSNNVQGLKLPFALAQDVSSRYRHFF